MRERTTWNAKEILKRAAMNRTADPYTMNQNHPQPADGKYVNGDPSSWAEDVHTETPKDKGYSGGETARNEIGMPEMIDKQAAENARLVKKADLCVKVARKFLGKTASENLVEDQAVAFMQMSDADLIDTFNRQAQAQEEQQAPAQEESKQAQEQTQQEEPKKEETQASAPVAAPSVTAESVQTMVAEALKPVFAMLNKKAQDEQGQAQQQAPAPAQEEKKEAAPQQAPVAQQDMQAMIQQAVQQQMAQMQQQQAPAAPATQTADEQLLDDMLAEPGSQDQGYMGEIEMEPAQMDVGDVGLGDEDAALQMLFAQDEEAQDAAEAQQKQASIRTASTRTVASRVIGTTPTQGVSRVGGGVTGNHSSRTASSNETERLAGLWESAPDVRDHFGMGKR